MMDRKIKYYISPYLLDYINFFRVFFKAPCYQKFTKNNKKWENYYKGQSVIIIGNGPSLNLIKKEFFFGKKVIVLNNFEKCTWKNQVEIVAHCIGEPFGEASWVKEDVELSIKGTKSLSYWLHFSSRDKLLLNPKKDNIHYVFPAIEPRIYRKKTIQLDKITMGYQTTAQLGIQVALYMGFSEISLVGFDHDWLSIPDYSRHFYSTKKDNTDTLGNMSYFEIINFMQRMWIIYYKLKDIMKYSKVTIYNLNLNSFLDIFEKKKIF